MRLLIQRCTRAEVRAERKLVGSIGEGLLVFLGVGADDTEAEAILRDLYPQGTIRRYASAVDPNKDFMIYFVEK